MDSNNNNSAEERYNDLTWQEFEKRAIDVLRAYYREHGIDLTQTLKKSGGETGGDGAHDGEAIHILASDEQAIKNIKNIEAHFSTTSQYPFPTSLQDPAVYIAIWAEVKKRTNENIGADDIANTFLHAFAYIITKVVVVTNNSFSENLPTLLNLVAFRSGLQYTLLNGEELWNLEKRLLPDEKPYTPAVHVDQYWQAQMSFTRNPYRDEFELSDLCLRIDREKPAFLAVDVIAGNDANLFSDVTVKVSAADAPLLIFPHSGCRRKHVGMGDRFRAVFAIIATNECEVHLKKLNAKLFATPTKTIPLMNLPRNATLSIAGSILPSWIPYKKQMLLDRINIDFTDWIKNGGRIDLAIGAIAGTGKSHFVWKLRQHWLIEGVRELLLDGENEQDERDFVESILVALCPIQVSGLTGYATLEQWLTHTVCSHQVAKQLVAYLQTANRRGCLPLPLVELTRLLALLLARASAVQPMVVVYEDLHKVLPSAVRVFNALRRSLSSIGKGHVATVFTSRESAISPDSVQRKDWSSALDELSMEQTQTSINITSLSEPEALELLRIAIPTLADHHGKAIVTQVGRTPFAIREALALLLEKAIMIPDGHGAYSIRHPDLLALAIAGNDFENSTALRLQGLRDRFPRWFADFIDAAACIGRSFDADFCAQSLRIKDTRQFDAVINACEKAEILRPSNLGRRTFQFDHDLIRSVLLHDMGSACQQRITQALYNKAAKSDAQKHLAHLSYQAGLSDKCFFHAMVQFEFEWQAQRYADALHSLTLALFVTDPAMHAPFMPDRSTYYGPMLDEALIVANPVCRTGLSDFEQRNETLNLLLEYADCATRVGSGGSPIVARAITQAQYLATGFGNKIVQARLLTFEGRQAFNMGQLKQSMERHIDTEAILGSLPFQEVSKKRTDNLVRLAIAQRQMGEHSSSRLTLLKALSLRNDRDWGLALKVIANVGATYFYKDLDRCRHYWKRAVDLASRVGHTEMYVHALIDLGHLDLILNKRDEAQQSLEEALRISEEQVFENQKLRALSNLACCLMMEGDITSSINLLLKADEIGIASNNSRRLWRVRANLATTMFLAGKSRDSAAWDEMVIAGLPEDEEVVLNHSQPWKGSRLVLAVGNLALRAELSEGSAVVFNRLPSDKREVGKVIADAVKQNLTVSLPGFREKHLKKMGDHRFFIVTE